MPEEKPAVVRCYQHRWVILLATVITFFLLFLAALPYAISYGLHKVLLENGGEEVSIEDIDFNIFTGRAAIENLQVGSGDEPLLTIPRLDLDVDWLPLFSRRVVIRAVSVEGVRLVVAIGDDGSLRVGGVAVPAGKDAAVEEAVEEAWGVGLETLQIAGSTIHYSAPELRLDTRVDEVTLNGLRTWTTDPAPVMFAGAINGAAVKLDGRLPPLSSGVGYRGRLSIDALNLATFAPLLPAAMSALEGRLTVDTEVDILSSGSQVLSVAQNGGARIAGLGLEHEALRADYAELRWDGTTTVLQRPGDSAAQVDLKGRLAGEQLAVLTPTGWLDIRQEMLRWEGTTAVSALPENRGVQVVMNSRLEGEGFIALLPEQGLDVRQGRFQWGGDLVIDAGETTAVTANGSLNLAATDAEAEAAGEKIRLAEVEGIEFGNVVLADTGHIMLTDLVARGAVFARDIGTGEDAGEAGSVLSAGSIRADRLRISAGGRIAIGTLEWRDVISTVVREPDGQWRPVRILDTLPFAGDEAQVDAGTPADTAAGGLQVDRIVISGKSAMVFADDSVKPPFRIRQYISKAELTDIDTARPEQRSRFLLRSSFGRHSRFDIDGTVQPFLTPAAVDLQVALEGVALTPLSPYTIKTLGYSLESGHLDADSTLRIDKGRLDGANKLTIRALEVVAAENASQESLDAELSMSLDTALGMLRDDNDTIKLDLPVTGDLDNPDFDISSVINTAVGKALRQGSLTYLTLALQPYGALITVARMAGEAASEVKLQPVGFEPGHSDAMAAIGDYLEKVAAIMKERPEINIKVCGRAVSEDRHALAGTRADAAAAGAGKAGDKAAAGEAEAAEAVSDERLLALARQRADFAKDKLVTDHGVAATRLVDCQPRVVQEGAPRVDLLI